MSAPQDDINLINRQKTQNPVMCIYHVRRIYVDSNVCIDILIEQFRYLCTVHRTAAIYSSSRLLYFERNDKLNDGRTNTAVSVLPNIFIRYTYVLYTS